MEITFDQLPSAVAEIREGLCRVEKLLSQNKEAKAEDKLLTIDEASLVVLLKTPTIYSLVAKKAIPFMKRGKRLWFSRDELTAWIRSGKNESSIYSTTKN